MEPRLRSGREVLWISESADLPRKQGRNRGEATFFGPAESADLSLKRALYDSRQVIARPSRTTASSASLAREGWVLSTRPKTPSSNAPWR